MDWLPFSSNPHLNTASPPTYSFIQAIPSFINTSSVLASQELIPILREPLGQYWRQAGEKTRDPSVTKAMAEAGRGWVGWGTEDCLEELVLEQDSMGSLVGPSTPSPSPPAFVCWQH